MPLPQHIFPVVTTSLLSISVSLFCFVIYSFFFLYIPHVSDNIQYLSFSVWPFSLRITSPGPSMLLQKAKISFSLWLRNISLCESVCVCVCVCVCVSDVLYPLSALGHLGCFHVLGMKSNAVINIGVHISSINMCFI